VPVLELAQYVKNRKDYYRLPKSEQKKEHLPGETWVEQGFV
jgi:hypothetical protein